MGRRRTAAAAPAAVSARSATRSGAEANGIPNAACSAFETESPAPSPRIARPPLISSSAAACFARVAAGRSEALETRVPTWSSGWRAATAARIANGSSAGRPGAPGGNRWSGANAPSYPAAAARGRRRQRTPRIGREHRQAEPELHPATASQRQERRADRAGVVAERRRHDRHLRAGRRHPPGRRRTRSRSGASRSLTRLARASPDHDDLRIEDVHQPCDTLAEPPPHLGEDPDRHGVVRVGRLGDELAGHPSGVAVREPRDRAVRVVLGRAAARARDREAARHLLPAAAVPAPAQGRRPAPRSRGRPRPPDRAPLGRAVPP